MRFSRAFWKKRASGDLRAYTSVRPLFTGASVTGSPVIRSPTYMTFRHQADVSPHTWSYDFAEACVFGKGLTRPLLILFIFKKKKIT
ncbi:hypothetical protein Hanom_Chr02g00138341 [Helianthus anomalus]